jgi:hypothetical protein
MAITKEMVFDAVINFTLITPLTLTFVVGTKMVIEDSIASRTGNNAAFVLLAVGVGIEFIVTYWQVSRPTGSYPLNIMQYYTAV